MIETAMFTIQLPSRVFEEQLPDLLGRLGKGDGEAEVTLDFRDVTYFTPAAIVALLAKLQSWRTQGRVAHFSNMETCGAFRYLQRINFFALSGLSLTEDFRRHAPSGRFVPLRRIGGPGAAAVEELSTDIADCIFPDANVDDPDESGLFDLLQYSVSELASNVRQHAQAPGFAMAQYAGQTDLIRVAIADSGIGIRQSFSESASPFWRSGMTDAEAIELALRPKVSSKAHLSTAWGDAINAGVGLTLLAEFCRNTDGQVIIASGNGIVSRREERATSLPQTTQSRFQGTVCSLAFRRSRIRNFYELLQAAKQSTGLLPDGGNLGNFFA